MRRERIWLESLLIKTSLLFHSEGNRPDFRQASNSLRSCPGTPSGRGAVFSSKLCTVAWSSASMTFGIPVPANSAVTEAETQPTRRRPHDTILAAAKTKFWLFLRLRLRYRLHPRDGIRFHLLIFFWETIIIIFFPIQFALGKLRKIFGPSRQFPQFLSFSC